jgi:CubicO group peptidase (beta-lactamase class C family)
MKLTPNVCLINIAFLSLLFAASVIGQDSPVASVDKFVTSEMERQKIPGVSLAVIKDGKPIIVKGYGLANVEHSVPVKPETVFQSGSVGKQFTAMAVMLLVEEGRIGLDEKISKYLGDVPPAWANITIRHLLTHTSGMTDYPGDFDFRKDFTEDELLKRAKEVPTAFAPGEKWAYSNLGYVTLGILIRKVSGKFYGDLLQERVFKPLQMTTARVISESDIVPNRAAGYILQNGEVKNQEWVSPSLNSTADGALYFTLLDMIKWEEALAAGKLLSKGGYQAMWSPVKLNNGRTDPYGFGWAVRAVNGTPIIEHGGAWQGFKAQISRYPEKNITVILFANLAQANQARIANGVAAIIDPDLKPRPITDPDPAFSRKIEDLWRKIVAGEPVNDMLTPDVSKLLKDSGKRIIDFVSTLGKVQRFDLFERNESGDGTRYLYRIEYAGMNLGLNITVDKDGKISSFGMRPE